MVETPGPCCSPPTTKTSSSPCPPRPTVVSSKKHPINLYAVYAVEVGTTPEGERPLEHRHPSPIRTTQGHPPPALVGPDSRRVVVAVAGPNDSFAVHQGPRGGRVSAGPSLRIPTPRMNGIRTVALTTGGAFDVYAVGTQGPAGESILHWATDAPLSIGAPLKEALEGLGARRTPRGLAIARYWLHAPPGTPAAAGASGDVALSLAVLVARRQTRRAAGGEATRCLAGSGRFAFREGEVVVEPVERWAAKLGGLRELLHAQPTGELRLVCPWSQVAQVEELLCGEPLAPSVRIIGVRTPEDVGETLAGWVEGPADLADAGVHSLRVHEALYAAGDRARADGRGYVSLRDLAQGTRVVGGAEDAALTNALTWAPADPRLPREGEDLRVALSPIVAKLLAALAPGTLLRELQRACTEAALLLAAPPTSAPDDSQTARPSFPNGLLVLTGPEQGRSIHPSPGHTIGRYRRGGVVDHPLYSDRSRGSDGHVHGQQLRWLGDGAVEGFHAWSLDSGARGAALHQVVVPHEVVHLQVGDILWLSPLTALRAIEGDARSSQPAPR